MLIQHFLAKQNGKRPDKVPIQFSADVIVLLGKYDWPGNVRELENVVERLVVLAEETVIPVDSLPANIRGFIAEDRVPIATVSALGIGFDDAVETYGNRLIDEALDRTRGNKQAAAALLGLKRTTLVAKLRRRTGTSVEVPRGGCPNGSREPL